MAKTPVIHRIVHLAIDVQSRYLASLEGDREHRYPDAVRTFADLLRGHHIPTIWVALFDNTSKFHSRQANWSTMATKPRHVRQLKKFDLTRTQARRDEDIFIKRANNAFEGQLTERLHSYHATTLIVTGMNTRFCVPATLYGAVMERFHCLVVTDLLADMSVHSVLDADPAWHRRTVEKTFLAMLARKIDKLRQRIHLAGRVEYCTTRDLLDAHRKGPAMAKKLARTLCGRKTLD